MITTAFLRAGFVVLKPVGERHRFDLVVERGRGFERVQCKAGRLRDGAVCFSACYVNAIYRGAVRRDYRGQIEAFGVYCADNDKCYLVPVLDVGKTTGKLRVADAKNGQVRGVRTAGAYELKW